MPSPREYDASFNSMFFTSDEECTDTKEQEDDLLSEFLNNNFIRNRIIFND